MSACSSPGATVAGTRLPGEAMDVGVAAAGPPAALDLQAVLLECEQQRLDRGVELQAETYGVEPEPGERVMPLRPENGFEVVDDLHCPRIQGGGARRSRDDGHLRALAPCAQ